MKCSDRINLFIINQGPTQVQNIAMLLEFYSGLSERADMTQTSRRIFPMYFIFMSIWRSSKHLVLSHLTLLLQSPTELLPSSLYRVLCTHGVPFH